jgi:hypothetical protein
MVHNHVKTFVIIAGISFGIMYALGTFCKYPWLPKFLCKDTLTQKVHAMAGQAQMRDADGMIYDEEGDPIEIEEEEEPEAESFATTGPYDRISVD